MVPATSILDGGPLTPEQCGRFWPAAPDVRERNIRCSAGREKLPLAPAGLDQLQNAVSFAFDLRFCDYGQHRAGIIIYPVLNFFHDFTLENTSGSPQSSVFFEYTADMTIESSALNDPSCIDPNTGNPCGGQLQFQFGDNRMREDRSMNPGDRERQHLNYTRAGNLGITKRSLVESGLSQAVADNLFHSAMTIRLNVHIRTRCVNQTPPPAIATIIANMRLFGD